MRSVDVSQVQHMTSPALPKIIKRAKGTLYNLHIQRTVLHLHFLALVRMLSLDVSVCRC